MFFQNKKHLKHDATGFFPGPGTFAHGVHPPEKKSLAADVPIEIIPTPEKVMIPLQQHIGGPCTPLVKSGQEVVFGEVIGKGEVFISAPIHAPISGVVKKSETITLANGRHLQAIVIKAAGEQIDGQMLWDQMFGGKWPQKTYQTLAPEKITEAIHKAGIVGLGGAAFPTHVKITPNDQKPIDILMVNGCECEPYLTTDFRVMVEAPEAVVAGALLANRAVGAKKVYIGIEDNKMEAVASLRHAASGAGVHIAVLKTKYPQGSEKHLIKAALNREVPLGGLPSDIGVAMTNVATAASVARGVMRDLPLTHRVVCVTGGGIVQPRNLLVPIGIAMGELIKYCGGLTKNSGPDHRRRAHDGICLHQPRDSRDQGHQWHHGAESRRNPAGGTFRLCSLRSLCGRLSHESGPHKDRHGFPAQ